MMKIVFYTPFLITFLAYTLSGQPSINLQLDNYFEEVLSESPAPGFEVSVVQGDRVIYSKGFGMEQIGKMRPMSMQSSLAIGSITKSFTALAIMQLVEKGMIDLDDKVIGYLPEFQTVNKVKSDMITVRMLINNTSGLPGGTLPLWESSDSENVLLNATKSIVLDNQPGRSYTYSNLAFSIAGIVISRVSGMEYHTYIEQNILKPLQMDKTITDPGVLREIDLLNGHHFGISGGLSAGSEIEWSVMSPAGSIMRSNVNDLSRYLIALLNQGNYQGRQIIDASSISELWKPQIDFPGLSCEKGGDGTPYSYGLGWMISEIEGRTIIHHGGSRGTMSSMTMIYPEKKLAATILFNIDYNFIDRYNYVPDLTIINNLFHLLEGEPLTDYGIPQEEDPYINNFELNKEEKKNYEGIYSFSGQGNTMMFQGSKLIVFQNSKGVLQGDIKRGGEILSQFEIDFINRASAVSRNVASPQKLHIAISAKGEVLSIMLSGSKFVRNGPPIEVLYKPIVFRKHRFEIPTSWEVRDEDGYLTLNNHDSREAQLFIYEPGNNSINERLKSIRENKDLKYSSKPIINNYGRWVWTQQSFIIDRKDGGDFYQVFINEQTGCSILICAQSKDISRLNNSCTAVLFESYHYNEE